MLINDVIIRDMDEVADEVRKNWPQLWKLGLPKRYIPPNGYVNPRFDNILRIRGITSPLAKRDRTHAQLQALSVHMIKHQFPTFFVGPELMQDLTRTRPPEEGTLADLQWPFRAVRFALPVKEIREFTGYTIPFVSMCITDVGITETAYDGYPVRVETGGRIILVWDIYEGILPVNYAGAYETHQKIKEVVAENYPDDHSIIPKDLKLGLGLVDLSREQDAKLHVKMTSLAFTLLMVTMARPNLIEKEVCERTEKRHRNGTLKRDALWQPNFVGRHYRSASEGTGEGGHLRVHLRRFHWKWQPHGPQNSLRKLILIKDYIAGGNEVEKAELRKLRST